MQQPKISIKNVSKVFHKNILNDLRKPNKKKKFSLKEDKIALNKINLTFNSGEIIGIVGRNGAGKSTLLSIIAGLSQYTEGELNISGKVTAVMTLGIGLREDLTGRENIYLDGELQGKSRDEMDLLLDEIITFAELDTFIDNPIKTYSTGMKSRLAFSMLIGVEPEILIIDEALSAGDIFFAQKASKKIKEICAKGKIVLLVSHAMKVINEMCNRCLWLDNGQVIMDDKPTVVTEKYLKAVREEEQTKELSAYQVPVSTILDKAVYKIQTVKLQSGQHASKNHIFYTGEAFDILIEVLRLCFNQALMHVTIERLDGLMVSSEQCDLILDSGELIEVTLSLDSLALNSGYYQLKIEVIEENLITNHFLRFFEVKNASVTSGGSPVLSYPAEIALVNKEVKVCSDSIELMGG